MIDQKKGAPLQTRLILDVLTHHYAIYLFFLL